MAAIVLGGDAPSRFGLAVAVGELRVEEGRGASIR
jgi:hypothetical protein